MSRDEAEAVLAHEVSHIANGDMVTLALIQGVVNTFVMFLSRVIGHTVDKVVFKTERGQGPAFYITMIVAELLLGILASIIVMWFSRQREFRADLGGANVAGRQKMIAALEKLKLGQARLQEGAQLPEKIAAASSDAPPPRYPPGTLGGFSHDTYAALGSRSLASAVRRDRLAGPSQHQ